MILTRRDPSHQVTMRRLDLLWARIVKARSGYKCERCGGKNGLNAAHIISRARKQTRWLLNNGFCACVGCHFFFHKNPLALIEWVNSRPSVVVNHGQARLMPTYEGLRIVSQPGRTKIDLGMIAAQLKAQAREFGVRL